MEVPDFPMGQLSPHLELQKIRVQCATDAPTTHTESIQYSGAYASMGVDNTLRLDQFFKDFKIEVINLTEDEMEFDMIGIDHSLANACRRILIAEVPTMVIEKVLIANNTSVIQDEVLSHRLGLIPIKADPRLFQYMSENDAPNEKNTIVFKLHSKCERGQPHFFSSQDSLSEFVNNLVVPVHPNIILAKLGSGQEIELDGHAVKGLGRTHAKWSPVSTAWYRMLPEVVLLQEIENEQAEELALKKCPAKVFDIEDIGNGKTRAVVARRRNCTLCRECIRVEDWGKRVALRRVKDHFIFMIESTGALPPEVLFTEAVKILEDKCERVISELS